MIRNLLLLLICLPQAQAMDLPVTWSLAGNWRVHDANDSTFRGTGVPASDWRRLKVPANWYSAGYDHQGALWYRHEFDLPESEPGTMATLVFDGIDYFADVTLNGKPLTHHEGYFQRFAVDVSSTLRRHNQLAIRVDSPYEDPQKVWPLHKTLIKGVLNQHDTRPGGAWSLQGQDANSGGIWAPVKLHMSRGVTIDEVILRPDWREGLENPALSAEIRYRATTAGPATVRLTAAPDNFNGQTFQHDFPITLDHATGEQQSLRITLPMKGAKLWWPVGTGKPNLYRVRASLRDSQGLMDTRVTRTGLRKLEEQPDNKGWLINDRRLFIKGSNYIGSPWLGTMTREKYRRDFALVQAMNANAIRVHGHVAGRPLYDVADEMGLMIWQDVPLQWGYDDSAAFTDNAVRQTREMVEQFGNSPAIIVWGGHNEPPWNSPWMEKRFPDWNKTLNRTLTQKVADTLAEDTSRIVHRFSAVEEHYWAGWYFGTPRDLLAPAKTAVVTEFGAQALPQLSTLKTIIPASLLWPKTTAADDPGWTFWKYHNFQPLQTFKFAGISRGSNIQEMIANTQRYQAKLVSLAVESYRRQRYQPVTALFHFMFVETWPSINWGVVDYLRQPKAGYYALQTAYQPVLPSIEPVTATWRKGREAMVRLWAINDTWNACTACQLKWQISQKGEVLAKGSETLTLPPDSGQMVKEITVTPQNFHNVEIRYRIENQNGKTVGSNVHEESIQRDD
ncbi:glycoside hydrolase family 2 protein [Pantoea stewartii]|uniref:glycoside hydrolase family 2 protein n=1 Tax=Pantoea stewartii TaxID=66269 RepID=UPI0012482474|nr:glycoside hydrolase family 2 TIM barrel-domain containing protein [Pantoea stewartii]KAB0549544.1 glycoside hydrolase family 2 [Pantoea stewartii subsp. stewartii]